MSDESMAPPSAEDALGVGQVTSTKKPFYKKKWVIALAVLTLIGVANSGGSSEDPGTSTASQVPVVQTPTPEVSQPAESSPSAEATQTALEVTFGSGMLEVGVDIQPGLYRGQSDGLGYWARLKSADGSLDAILANANPTGQTYVQILATDKYFESNGIDTWTLITKKTKPEILSTIPGSGVFKVGLDIAPGTYKSSASEGMGYWARLRNASGGLNAIIANDNVTGSSFVTIKKSDKFFETNGMNDWVKR